MGKNMKRMLWLLCLLLHGAAFADCPRVTGQEEDRRANAGCLILHDDKVLLITHRWGGKLGVPGGTREADELAQCTAHRETYEETGLDVTVGRRLAVMKNGFHLYRCYPESGSSPEPLPVPTSALTEVKALDWYLLDSLDRDRWRFAYQFELFLEVTGNAILDEQGGQQ
jgi:8-oxo-dGTP pyrophosphatase MutT (NUDIX family)